MPVQLTTWLMAWTLAAVLSGGAPGDTETRGAAEGAAAAQRDKDPEKDKQKDKQKEAGTPPASPEWSYGPTPYATFLWLAREMPDFYGFNSDVTTIEISMAAHRDKNLLFFDGCKAQTGKAGWTVSDCKAVELGEDEFLSRLVAQGTDLSGNPDTMPQLDDTLSKVRKAGKLEDLLPLFSDGGMANAKGYKLSDDVELDMKQCGTDRYRNALSIVPSVRFLGPHVVFVDVTLSAERPKGAYRVKLTLLKIEGAWKLGGLRVVCY